MEHSKEPKWYVLHTYSGYENVVKENLENVIKKFNLENRIFEIVIPEEDVIEEKNGKQKLVTRKTMPCYVFIKMIYGDDLQHNIVNTRGVTGFTGPKGRPLALTDDEVLRMRLEKIKVETDIEVGDMVEVVEGPLDKMVGKVIGVDAENNQVTIAVEMFGRENNVELALGQVHKINQ